MKLTGGIRHFDDNIHVHGNVRCETLTVDDFDVPSGLIVDTLQVDLTSTFLGNVDVQALTQTDTLQVDSTSLFIGNVDVTALVQCDTLQVDTTSVFLGNIDLTGNIDIFIDESSAESSIKTTLASNAIIISTDYTVDNFMPGLIWKTDNDNATKPKMGIWGEEAAAGTSMHFGTSDTYTTGITNTALTINPAGDVRSYGNLRCNSLTVDTGMPAAPAGISTFINNASFEDSINNWTAVGLSFTAETTDELVGAASGKITLTASIGDTLDGDLVGVGEAHKEQSWKVEFYYENSATYVNETLQVYLLCDSTEVLVGCIKHTSEKSRFFGYVDPIEASTYKLRFKSATGVVNASTVVIDSVVVYPQEILALQEGLFSVTTDVDYTVDDNVNAVFVDSSSGAITITIPSEAVIGKEIVIRKTSASNLVTINRSGVDVFGASSLTTMTLLRTGDYVRFQKSAIDYWDFENGAAAALHASETYDSGWVDSSNDWTGNEITITHSLNANLTDLDVTVYYSVDATEANAINLTDTSTGWSSTGDAFNGVQLNGIDSNSLLLTFGQNGFIVMYGAGLYTQINDVDAGSYRVIAVKRETKDFSNLYRAGWNSGWVYTTSWTNALFTATHNLGAGLVDLNVDFLVSETGSDTDCYLVYGTESGAGTAGTGDIRYGLQIQSVDSNNIECQTGSNGITTFIDSSGNGQIIDAEAWYYKIVITKKEFDSIPTVDVNVKHTSVSATTQSIPNEGAGTDIIFESVNSSNGITQDASGIFTVETAGWYQINVGLMFSSVSQPQGTIWELSLRKNDAVEKYLFRDSQAATLTYYKMIRGSAAVYFEVEDEFNLRIYQNSGAAITFYNRSSYNWMTVVKYADKFIGTEGSGSEAADSVITGTAGETITAGDVVYFATDGKLYIADKRYTEKVFVSGIATSSVATDASLDVQKLYSLDIFTGLSAGVAYYLGDAGALVPLGSIGYNDYKVYIGTATATDTLDLNVGTPEYRNTQDDGNLVGSLHYFPTYEDRAGYLPTAFDNAVSQANYSELYSVVGDIYEEMHTDAGDAASGTGMFYPTPIPGYYRRTAIPDVLFDTGDVDTTNNRLNITSDVYKSRTGTPFYFKTVGTATLPTTSPQITEDTPIYVYASGSAIVLYASEADAVAGAGGGSLITISATGSGTFRLTQEGIALDDAFQGHRHPRTRTELADTGSGILAITDGGSEGGNTGDPVADGTNGTPRTTNETRGKTVHGYEYIKACYVTPAGEPVSALRYDTGWVQRDEGTPADNWQDAELCVTHGLDGKEELIVKFFLKTAGGSIVEIGQSQRNTSTSNYGYIIKYVDDNNLYIETGADGLLYVSASSGGSVSALDTQDDWYYKVVVTKPALVATYAPVPANYSYDIATSDTIHHLPTAVGYTGEITVFWTGGDGSNDITFTTVGSQTIDGLAASVWVGEGEGLITLVSDNTNWLVKEYRDSGTGWKKEADGGMKQWGTQAVSSSSQTVTFSKTFISAAIQVVANHETAARMVAVVALATTNCTLNVSAYDGSNDISGADAYWTATGRWRT